MLIKSNIKEGLILGDFKGTKGSDKYIKTLVEELNGISDFDFKLDGNYFSILPILTYYSAYADIKDMAKRNIYKYINIMLKEEYKISDIDASSIYSMMGMAIEVSTKQYYKLLKDKEIYTNIYMCSKFIYNIGALSDRRDCVINKEVFDGMDKLKLMAVDDAYINMVGFMYSLKCEDTKYGTLKSIVTLAYRLEDMLAFGGCDIDAKVCEFMYLALRYYLDYKLDSKVVFGIDLGVTLDSYGETIESYLDGISKVIVPLSTTPYGKLINSEIYIGVLNVLEDVHSRLHYEIITKCKDVIDVIAAEKESSIKDYKSKDKLREKDMQSLRANYKSKEKEVKYLTKKLEKVEKNDTVTMYKDKVSELEELVKKLEGKLEQRDARIVNLESKLSEVSKDTTKVEEVVEGVVLKEDAPKVTFEDKVKAIRGNRYVVIGGNSSLEKGLKNILPNVAFKKEGLNFEISNKVDYILLYTKNIGHTNTYKATTFSSSLKGIIPLYNSNIVKIVDTIYNYTLDKSISN